MKNTLKGSEIYKSTHALLPANVAIKNTMVIQRWGSHFRNITEEVSILSTSHIKCRVLTFLYMRVFTCKVLTFFFILDIIPTIKKLESLFSVLQILEMSLPSWPMLAGLPIIMKCNQQMALFLILIVVVVLEGKVWRNGVVQTQYSKRLQLQQQCASFMEFISSKHSDT